MFNIKKGLGVRPEAIRFHDDFVNSKTLKKFVLGTNSQAISISDFYEIDGFIDDRFFGRRINNYPVFKLEQIDHQSLIISTLTGILPVTFKRKLDKKNLRNINYIEFSNIDKNNLPPVWYLGEARRDLIENLKSYETIYALLSDDYSREIFEKLILFKITGNLDYMMEFADCQQEQYFDPVLNLSKGEIFVDVGGFDGFTSLEFARRCPSYKSIHLFEPDVQNLHSAKINLSTLDNVNYYQFGLSDKKCTLHFSSDGSSSHVSENGDSIINVDKLDDLLREPYTFLKMDIEGAEADAIAGAKESIMKYHPKLAISVYHKVDDFWKIPELVLAIRDDYDVYLRHYTEGFTETVMFFIPRI